MALDGWNDVFWDWYVAAPYVAAFPGETCDVKSCLVISKVWPVLPRPAKVWEFIEWSFDTGKLSLLDNYKNKPYN